ncbi:tetratricopeptide repeat protein [Nodosilinea sp. LEGE 07298]|uniref:tetratricopeptide repeat protein n=1 Tax=Nodosilinea sp. LEGE 07298 TaxID=2777970 RepID=UPI001881E2F2|nr:tetratricopeptide repeat protein [Nodosilinea sp. LEGE 07298]MBE9112379.1 tetratricopeptide repeat protein [Nodosilinea sp. LEGE 07298]
MTDDTRDRAKTRYAQGQAAFERGSYREAVECFEEAVALAKATTPLGGEIQTWLVNAYSAVGKQSDAIALCQALARHPDLETRKQGKNLLYILQAPQLQRPTNWMTEIPDLDKLSADGAQSLGQAGYSGTKSASRPRPKLEEPTIDPSEINSKDNGFLWAALIGVALVLGGLLWLS